MEKRKIKGAKMRTGQIIMVNRGGAFLSAHLQNWVVLIEPNRGVRQRGRVSNSPAAKSDWSRTLEAGWTMDLKICLEIWS